tara:strand:- start:1453 stop:2124 length:672 start_codon:yes stop_codon:yes gene_type:complete
MESSSVYDTFLVRFKKDLWNKCVEFKVFDYIGDENVEKTKQVFENIVANYQSQILQHEDKGNAAILYEKLINEISKELTPLKKLTRDSIQQDKKNQFDQQVEQKQKEFNTMMNKDVPPTPQFSDDQKDEPIEKENLDELIEKQMREREKVMNRNENNEPQNIIVASPSHLPYEVNHVQHRPMNIPEIPEVMMKINKIEETMKIQSTILQQIVQSQLAILRKLK